VRIRPKGVRADGLEDPLEDALAAMTVKVPSPGAPGGATSRVNRGRRQQRPDKL